MSRIKVLLQDVEPDKSQRGRRKQSLLLADQWDDLIAAWDRGISIKTIFAKCSGDIKPFYANPKALQNALTAERKKRGLIKARAAVGK